MDICTKSNPLPTSIDILSFLRQPGKESPVIDVRTPAEFAHGHIPGAINIPLFSNEERAVVGTLYKQQGKQPAILKGLEFVGPRMAEIAATASSHAAGNTLYIHCWRGGMRSGSVAWLMEAYGLKVYTLKGGYKSFRHFALGQFSRPLQLMVLGGKTGSGKTDILAQLKQCGEQVIDLEKLACHKGSAFGALGEVTPPTQEQFENELAMALFLTDPLKRTWLEDESRLIGKKVIPNGLWEQMRDAPVSYIELPPEERVHYLVREYGKFPLQLLKESIERISRRLGPQHAKQALLSLDAGDLRATCEICLKYYDKSYNYGIEQRQPGQVKAFAFDKLDPASIAKALVHTNHTFTNDRD